MQEKQTKIQIKENEIRPIEAPEIQRLNDIIHTISVATQSVANTVQRHILTNVSNAKILQKDNNNISDKKTVSGGFRYRAAQQLLASYPTITLREHLIENKAPKYSISLLTALSDTTLSMPFEALATRKNLQSLGIDIAMQDLSKSATKSYFPFFMRNLPVWFGINEGNDKELLEKMGYSSIAGLTSVPFHNIGIRAMSHPDKTFAETWKVIKEEIVKKPLTLFQGGIPRIVTTLGANIVLDSRTLDVIKTGYTNISDFFTDNTPSTKPNPQSSKPISVSKNNCNERCS